MKAFELEAPEGRCHFLIGSNLLFMEHLEGDADVSPCHAFWEGSVEYV